MSEELRKSTEDQGSLFSAMYELSTFRI